MAERTWIITSQRKVQSAAARHLEEQVEKAREQIARMSPKEREEFGEALGAVRREIRSLKRQVARRSGSRQPAAERLGDFGSSRFGGTLPVLEVEHRDGTTKRYDIGDGSRLVAKGDRPTFADVVFDQPVFDVGRQRYLKRDRHGRLRPR